MTDFENDDGEKRMAPLDGDTQPEQPLFVKGGWGTRFLWAPWDSRKNIRGTEVGPGLASSNTLVAMVLEFLFSLILGFAVVAARRYSALGTAGSALEEAVFIGAVHALVFLVAWRWSRDYSLKRYLNWAFLAGKFPKFRASVSDDGNNRGEQGPDYGLIAFILFGGCQIAGAAVAGTFLGAFNLGALPNPSNKDLSLATGSALTAMQTAPVFVPGVWNWTEGVGVDTATSVSEGLIWVCEFFAVFCIVLANIYTDERHQEKNNNGGNARENEATNHNRTGDITAAMIFIMTVIFYPVVGSYSFGPVPYFAGLVAIGTGTLSSTTPTNAYAGNSPATPLVDWAHYMFTNVGAGAAAGLVAYFFSWLLTRHFDRRRLQSMRGGSGAVLTSNRAAYRSARTPLLRRQQRPSHLRESAPQGARQRRGPY